MATVYVKFKSSSNVILSSDCTTRWPDSVQCYIPLSGLYETKRTNLMVMNGDNNLIADWIADNVGKVVEITEEEGNNIGQTIVPENTINVCNEYVDGVLKENTYTAGLFTMSGGLVWELTNSVDV